MLKRAIKKHFPKQYNSYEGIKLAKSNTGRMHPARLIKKVKGIYSKKDCEGFSVLDGLKQPFCEITNRLILNMKNEIDPKDSMQSTLDDFNIKNNVNRLLEVFEDLFNYVNECEKNNDTDYFLRSLSILQANNYSREKYVSLLNTMLPNPIPNSLYVDLASGINFSALMYYFNNNEHYVAVDKSLYVCSFIFEMAKINAKKNLSIIHDNIEKMQKPPGKVGVLRMKNVNTYIPKFDDRLNEIPDWIENGGFIIMQTDPSNAQRFQLVIDRAQFAEKLLSNNWKFAFRFGKVNRCCFAYDTLVFRKPYNNADTKKSEDTWKDYCKEVLREIEKERIFEESVNGGILK